jgi:hypothetical protein
MATENVPGDIAERYRIKEWNHAAAILAGDFPAEWKDILACLRSFKLRKSAIIVGGGGRSLISVELDRYLNSRGWKEKQFDIGIRVDGADIEIPTHKYR